MNLLYIILSIIITILILLFYNYIASNATFTKNDNKSFILQLVFLILSILIIFSSIIVFTLIIENRYFYFS